MGGGGGGGGGDGDVGVGGWVALDWLGRSVVICPTVMLSSILQAEETKDHSSFTVSPFNRGGGVRVSLGVGGGGEVGGGWGVDGGDLGGL